MRQDIGLRQLDERLAKIDLEHLVQPPGGWIKSVREAIGMTTGQLAHRLGVDQSMIVKHEGREQRGTMTVQKLRDVANALDCDLVYAFKPRRPLMEQVRARAYEKARRIVGRVSHSMSLEAQSQGTRADATQIDQLAEDLLREKWSKLWADAPDPR